MKVSKEFKTGIVIILAIGTLFFGINFLKGFPVFGGSREYYAVYNEVSGLTNSSPVMLNGVQIGQVRDKYLHPNDATKVIVKFSIDNEDLQIPRQSVAEIFSSDILGTKAIRINLNTEVGNSSFYEVGDTMASAVEASLTENISKEILPVKKKAEELISSIDNIVVSIGAFWDTSAAYTLDESLFEVRNAISNIGTLTRELNSLVVEEKMRLSRIFQNIESISENLKNSNEQIKNILANVATVTDSLADSDIKAVINNVEQTLASVNQVLDDVKNGKGTLGQLVKNDSLYYELVRSNQSIQSLLYDLQQNPNRYIHFSVFGKKDKGIRLTPREQKKLQQVLDSVN